MKNSESRRNYYGLPKLLSKWSHQHGRRLFSKLQASVAIAAILSAYVPLPAMAQQAPPAATAAAPPAPGLPPAPVPNYTQPFTRPSDRDFTRPHPVFPNFLKTWEPITVEAPVTSNSQRLEAVVHNGKIYLSLADAIVLGLENNYDIAIQRYNLDIADTELLRARAGSSLLGVPAGLVQGTLNGSGGTSSSSLTSGGGPGGTSTASGGAAAGAGGINVSTNGQGPTPEVLDPVLTGTMQLERTTTPEPTPFASGTPTLNQNQDTYNFNYNQGFITGTQLQVAFNNSRITNNGIFNAYSPQLQSTFKATVTQHLLNGFGPGINGRFILEAKNNRRITDSAFRLQILYTINQIENIYWVLVSDYEDVQAKQRALEQSTRLASDNRKQLQIGTLAPLDVLNADNQVSTDTQALITSQTSLEYQQLIMKQAISRDLSDPALSGAPVIPTDRVSLLEMPEERTPVEDLVQKAYANRPEIEQNILNLRNDEITLRATKNNLLPSVDLYGFYAATALGGSKSPFCQPIFGPGSCDVPTIGYGTVFTNLFNSSGPDKGAGVNVNVPLRNRTAQSLQARALLEYRQAEMRLQQLYIQVRIQVINGQYALTNDRAAVQAALAAREYNYQSYQSEVKKLRLGASTTANVLQQERNLATAENNIISTEATYAKDRASLEQLLAQTLDQYGIQLSDAVKGTVTKEPVIPGLEPAKAAPEANVPGQQQQLQHTEQMPPLPVMPTQPKLTPQEEQNLPPGTPPTAPPQ